MPPEPTPGDNPGASLDALKKELEKQKEEVKTRDQSIRALTQKAHAWDKLSRQLGDSIEYDPDTGLPVKINAQDAGPAVRPNASKHPLAELLGDGEYGKVDEYYKSLLGDHGNYLTKEDAQKLVKEAMYQVYNASRGDFSVLREIDRLMAMDEYKDLGKYDSELSKLTQRFLSENKMGEPLEDAQGWDSWRYADLQSLKHAADMGRAELVLSGQAKQKEMATAGANQSKAGLSVSGVSMTNSEPQAKNWKEMSPSERNDALKDHAVKHFEAQGVKPNI